MNKELRHRFRVPLILLVIWLVGAFSDRLWITLDHAILSWDPTNHLRGSLSYWDALQNPQWFSGEWWWNFWQLSSKYPPLTYIATAPFQLLFGTGPDPARLVNLFFSAVLLISVFGLGKHLFNTQVGLWAAAICVLLPRLYINRIDYLLDYPLTAIVAASFWCLTVWKDAKNQRRGWLWALAFGICLGLAMLVKQSVVFFLFVPLLWLGGTILWQRRWGKLAQLISALLVSVLVFGPWYRANWIYSFSLQETSVNTGLAEGDPPLNTLAAWTYYWYDLPRAISWPLLLVPLVGLLLYGLRLFPSLRSPQSEVDQITPHPAASLGWLMLYFAGSYLIFSAIVNKDLRYIMPYLPMLSVILGYGMTLWQRRLAVVPWVTLGLALVLMYLNLFPIGGVVGTKLTALLSPQSQRHAYLGQEWPHAQVIEEILQTEPFLRANIGVLPTPPQINHNNINYYGALNNFQVHGREVGIREHQLVQDARSLDWFITKTGDQGPVRPVQPQIVQLVEQSPDFKVQQTWLLPDNSTLMLHHRTPASVEVEVEEQGSRGAGERGSGGAGERGSGGAGERGSRGAGESNHLKTQDSGLSSPIQLEQVIVPQQSPPGVPVPVTYQWSGSWEQLHSGLVLLTWQKNNLEPNSPLPPPPSGLLPQDSGLRTQDSELRTQDSKLRTQNSGLRTQDSGLETPPRWLHDHGIGEGRLHPGQLRDEQRNATFRVTERLAMLPPASVTPGTYSLTATYLNRETGESYPLDVPSVTLNIAPDAVATPAPEVDLVTQMRNLATNLPKGREALDLVFEEVGRINQYDPTQDYTEQAELTLAYRLQQEPDNLDWAYALAFSRVLQEDAQGAIAALQRVVQLDSQNPYAHAYLGFVYLYQWRPKAAAAALQPALAINPDLPEIQALDGAAALLQGNLLKGWRTFQNVKNKL